MKNIQWFLNALLTS